MVLLCEVRGGLPPPKIQWLWNGKSIDSTMLDFSFAGSQTSKLVIKNLSRIHQHSIVTCRASNFPKTETTANVTIDLLCKFVYGNQSIFFHFQYLFEMYLNFFNDFFFFCLFHQLKAPICQIIWSFNNTFVFTETIIISDNHTEFAQLATIKYKTHECPIRFECNLWILKMIGGFRVVFLFWFVLRMKLKLQ